MPKDITIKKGGHKRNAYGEKPQKNTGYGNSGLLQGGIL